MGTKIAELYASIGADTSGLKKGLDETKTGMTQFKGTLNETLKALTGFNLAQLGVGAALGLTVREVRKAIGETIDYAKTVRELSQNLNITSEETSRLIQVADDWGITSGQVESAMKMALKNGYAPTIDNLAQLADQYVDIQDPTERAAIMTETFGRNWAELVPILKQGGDALREQAAAVSDGLIMTDAAIAKAREFEVATDNLNDSIQSLKFSIGNAIIPPLANLAERLNDSITNTSAMGEAITTGRRAMEEGIITEQQYASALEQIRRGYEIGYNALADWNQKLDESDGILLDLARAANYAKGQVNQFSSSVERSAYSLDEFSTKTQAAFLLDALAKEASEAGWSEEKFNLASMRVMTTLGGMSMAEAQAAVSIRDLRESYEAGLISMPAFISGVNLINIQLERAKALQGDYRYNFIYTSQYAGATTSPSGALHIRDGQDVKKSGAIIQVPKAPEAIDWSKFMGSFGGGGGGGGISTPIKEAQKEIKRLFQDIDTGLDSTMRNFDEELTFVLAGGYDLQKKFEDIKDELERGKLSPAEAKEYLAPLIDEADDLKIKLKEATTDVFEQMGQTIEKGAGFARFGSAVEERFKVTFIDPLEKDLDRVDARIEDITSGKNSELEALKAANPSYAAEWEAYYLNDLAKERLSITDQIAEKEQHILDLQKQQGDLDFLSAQVDFLQMLKQYGISPEEVLGGARLGTGADTAALIDAMTRALSKVVEKASGQINYNMNVTTNATPESLLSYWKIPVYGARGY